MDNYYGPITPELREWHEEMQEKQIARVAEEAEEAEKIHKQWLVETPLLKRICHKLVYSLTSPVRWPLRPKLGEADTEFHLRKALYYLAINLPDGDLYKKTKPRKWYQDRKDYRGKMHMNFIYQMYGPRGASELRRVRELGESLSTWADSWRNLASLIK
ncbi:MAG: hypothetical protein ABIH72_01690 [archaeon]